jgi:hypothetical protein
MAMLLLRNVLEMTLGEKDMSRGVTEPAANTAAFHCDRDVYSVLSPVGNIW